MTLRPVKFFHFAYLVDDTFSYELAPHPVKVMRHVN